MHILHRFQISALTAWSLCFCLGIVAGHGRALSPGILLPVIVVVIVAGYALMRRPGPAASMVFFAAFLLGMLRVALFEMVACDDISRIDKSRKGIVFLSGRVASEPRVSDRVTTFVLDVEGYHKEGETGALSGQAWVRSWKGKEFVRGQRYTLEGRLSPASGYLKRMLKRRRIDSVLNVSSAHSVIRHKKAPRLLVLLSPATLKKKAEHIFAENSEPTAAGLLQAMILGEAQRVPRPVKDAMIRTGTWHIMVVSGSHTAFLAFVFLLIFKILRLPRRLRYILTATCVVVYCFLTGASTPVVRATCMTLVFLASFIVERNTLFYHTLALAALVIVFFDPSALFQVGFQLSFTSVFFIVWLYPKVYPQPLLDRMAPATFWLGRVARCLVSYAMVAFCAWVGTTPILLYHFQSISWVTVPANVLVVPVAMAAVSAGFMELLAGFLAPPLAVWFASACEGLIYLLLRLNAVFAGLPWGYMKIPS